MVERDEALHAVRKLVKLSRRWASTKVEMAQLLGYVRARGVQALDLPVEREAHVRGEGSGWVEWRRAMDGWQLWLRKQQHSSMRVKQRSMMSWHMRRRDEMRVQRKMKGYINSVLRREGRKGGVVSLTERDGTGAVKKVISDPVGVCTRSADHWDRWCGKGRQRWYRGNGAGCGWLGGRGVENKLYRMDAAGLKLRQQLSRGEREAQELLPEKLRYVAEACKVKQHKGREVCEEDYRSAEGGLCDEIGKEEWKEHWRWKGWQKAGGRSGLRPAHLKCLVGRDHWMGEVLRRGMM